MEKKGNKINLIGLTFLMILVILPVALLWFCEQNFLRPHLSFSINSAMIYGFWGSNILAVIVLILFTSFFSLLLIAYPRHKAAITIILIGIIKNLLDRILLGGVFDYMKLGNLITLNLADILIVSGAVFLGAQYLSEIKKSK